jgi:hypothetical protein
MDLKYGPWLKWMLSACDRMILKTLYGPVTEHGDWRISTNQELRELYEITDSRY